MSVDWRQPRFDAEGTGFNPFEHEIGPTNVGTLQLAWSAAGEGDMETTPIEVDGIVYMGGQVDLSGASDLYAFDAMTGRLIAKKRVPGTTVLGITVAGGRLYMSILTAHMMRAYDVRTGSLLWTANGPTMSPTAASGVVYAGDDLRSFWAIDGVTGQKLWVDHVHSGGYGFGAAVADGVVYTGTSSTRGQSPVIAYDATTGAELWRTWTQGQEAGTPAVSNGTVYIGSGDHHVYAMDAGSGRIRWIARTSGVVAAPAAVAHGRVFVGAATGDVYGFDSSTGTTLWTASTPGPISAGQAVIVANDVVYVGSGSSEYALDAATGAKLWSADVGGPFRQSVVNGTLYVGSFDDHLYAFRPTA